jgi:hypothetical protein
LTRDELEQLRGFVSSATYREALVEPEGHYRLARVYEFLGRPARQIAEAYLIASWETPHDDDDIRLATDVMEGRRDRADLLAAKAHYLWYVDQALTFYRAALKEGGLDDSKAGEIRLRCVELSRLVGRFGDAERFAREFQRTTNLSPVSFQDFRKPVSLRDLLTYEARLVRNRDADHHRTVEAVNRSPEARKTASP